MRWPPTTRPVLVATLRWVGRYLVGAVAVALVALPLVVEQAVERTSFADRVGTLPVEMSLSHDGRSTLSTGVLGDVYWDQTGPWGFGIRARATAPPQAGGTLASYADPAFIRSNLQFIDDPDAAVASYAAEFRAEIVDRVVTTTAVVACLGGFLTLALRARRGGTRTSHRRLVTVVVVLAGFAASSAGAAWLFDRWPGNHARDPGYVMPDLAGLRFSSPQTLEIARQVRPFLEKNAERIAEKTAEFQASTETTFAEALEESGVALEPRDGEVIVLAEADPQGSQVGTAVRKALVERILERFGEDAVAFRTISGDITSNGTVAEDRFVEDEAAVGGDLPTVAVAGDHDSETTQSQMDSHGMVVPDLTVEEVAGLRVAGANDVEHKALFGALVDNPSGMSQQELGQRLREEVDEGDPLIVLLHQPAAAAGYLGLDGSGELRELDGSLTVPYDDGIADVPPGTVNIGHLHETDGPWVLWNTDGEDEVTWTVVDQLGTSGGVENRPTFNRFSTPVSIPLKDVSFRLQFFDTATGLQTGFATVTCTPAGACTVSGRTDVGLPLDADVERGGRESRERPAGDEAREQRPGR